MDKAQLFTIFTEKYRRLLYWLCRMPTKGIMQAGKPCNVEDPTLYITHGDVVHPCVRYIEEGYEGHQWWMVYTPLYAGKDYLENPRLYYADVNEEQEPIEWKYYCTIKDKPPFGYNSDPTMFFKDDRLYIFWRECKTPKTYELGCCHATMGCFVKDKTVNYFENPLMMENDASDDKEVCPTIMAKQNAYKAYAMHLATPIPEFIKLLPGKIGSMIYRHHLLAIAEGLGFYKSARSLGVAIWEGSSLNAPLNYSKTVEFKNVAKLYQPWHMDLFSDGNIVAHDTMYAVVQSSIKFADICLALSDDGEHFVFFRKPLLTSKNIGMSGLYKSTALVVKGKFYLFYTARDNEDCHLNRLFMTTTDWQDLLNLMTKYK